MYIIYYFLSQIYTQYFGRESKHEWTCVAARIWSSVLRGEPWSRVFLSKRKISFFRSTTAAMKFEAETSLLVPRSNQSRLSVLDRSCYRILLSSDRESRENWWRLLRLRKHRQFAFEILYLLVVATRTSGIQWYTKRFWVQLLAKVFKQLRKVFVKLFLFMKHFEILLTL